MVLQEEPVEKFGTICTVERYHDPLREAFLKIRMDFGRDLAEIECLKMDVFYVTSIIGPEGLCPILSLWTDTPSRQIQTIDYKH